MRHSHAEACIGHANAEPRAISIFAVVHSQHGSVAASGGEFGKSVRLTQASARTARLKMPSVSPADWLRP